MGVLKRKIPYEITAYKGKFILGLTLRQLICAACMLVLAVPTGFFGWKFFGLSSDTLGWIILVEVAPFAAIGWATYNDMPIEKIAGKVLLHYFGCQKRKWEFTSPETRLVECAAKLNYIQVSVERAEELENERSRAKEQRKEEKKNRKAEKKKRRKGSNDNA